MQEKKRIEGYRLSAQQRRLCETARWWAVYKAVVEVEVDAEVDEARLRRAVEEVVGRHEALRTELRKAAGMKESLQVIREVGEVEWEQGGEGAERVYEEEVRRESGEEGGAAVRVRVSKGVGSSRVVISVAGMSGDEQTMKNIVEEVFAFYSSDDSTTLTETPVRYVQFSEWQNELLESEESEAGKEYWAKQRQSSNQRLIYPFEINPSNKTEFKPTVLDLPIEPQLAASINRIAESHKTTAANIALGCWSVLISRLCGDHHPEIALASPARSYEELQSAIGLYQKWLPISLSASPNIPFNDLLDQIHRAKEDALHWQDYFLWGATQQETQSYPTACYEYIELGSGHSGRGLRWQITNEYVCVDRYKLKLVVVDKRGHLSFHLHFDSNLFLSEDISRLADQLITLLQSVSDKPEGAIGKFEILSHAERQRLLVDFNNTEIEYEKDKCIHDLFAEQAERTPNNVAVVVDRQTVTYAELNARANQLAHRLRSLGVEPDVRVAICVERSLDSIVGLLGILKAGGAYVPLDVAQPKRRLAFMLEDANASVLLTQKRLVDSLPEQKARVVCLDRDWPEIALESKENPVSHAELENLVYVVFTSGSTGRPKGVMIEHRQLLNYVNAIQQRLDFPRDASFATVTTMAADLGNTVIFPSLLGGGTLHVVSQERASDSEAIGEYFTREQIDCLKVVPSHLAALLTSGKAEEVVPQKRLVMGGETCRWELVEQVRRLRPACEIYNHYGPTETTIGVLTYRATEGRGDTRSATVPLGRPIANAKIHLLDAEMQPVPVWSTGELFIGGDGLARGYLQRADLTAEKFIPDPFSQHGERLYRTGDLARYLPDGNIEFLGRADDQVKYHGYRVELNEIRCALNRHAQVRNSLVIIAKDKNGNDVIMAYYVSRREIDASELRAIVSETILEETLPNVYVHLKKIPLTLNGKIDYRALPTLEEVRQQGKQSYIAPVTDTEQRVAEIYAQVLGIERVSRHENFFELGGHSLLATQVISRVRAAFNIDVPLRSLFESPVLAELARSIDAANAAGQSLSEPSIKPVPREGNLPLSFAQQRLWFLHQLDPSSFAYNIARAVRLSGSLDLNALEKTLSEIIRRHESLRTRFATLDGQPVQVIEDARAVTLEPISLLHLPESDRLLHATELAKQEARQPFDLELGNLIRVKLVKLGDDDHIVIMTMHHIISDEWSMAILVKEIAHLYDCYCTGRHSQLEELDIQYADFAVWQRAWLSGDVLEKQLQYWKKQLGGNLKPLNLPTDRQPSTESYRGGAEAVEISKEVYEAVKRLSQEQGATVFMVMLAAFKAMLAKYTGEDEIVVGTDVANRNRVEVENIIGFFVNHLVLRTDLRGNPTFREMVKRVREVAIGAYAHQDLPFDKLVAVLRPDRDLGQTPLFQILFLLESLPAEEFQLSGLKLSHLEASTNTTKYDLTVFMLETQDGLVGVWRYNTDLFDASTIKRIAGHFNTLLSTAIANPDLKLDALDIYTEEEKRQREAENREHKESKLNRLKSARRKVVNVSQESLVTIDKLNCGENSILMAQPAAGNVDLIDWARINKESIEAKLLEHGAILFRGFNKGSLLEFEQFAAALCPELFEEYGDLPRQEISNKVYASTPYPSHLDILFHNESSHMNRWPMKIWFMCLQPPLSGGQTPFADSRLILNSLSPRIRDRFADLGILYVRNFTDGLDVSWQQFFRTSDKLQVERFCLDADISFQWTANNSLRTTKWAPAITSHPKTGDAVFFNQILAHHISCLQKDVKDSLLQLFDEHHLPRNVYYGDGSPIEDDVIDHLIALYDRQAVKFDWRLGDILMLDNMLSAHGRSAFSGNRKVVVTMGEMVGKQQALTNRG